MAACRAAGSCAVASIVRSSVASDGGGSCERQAASTAAACAALVEADSVFYAPDSAALVERFSAGAAATETRTRCPLKSQNISINVWDFIRRPTSRIIRH